MISPRTRIALAALALALGRAAPALADDGLAQLEQKASFWEAQGRRDKAAETWEQVLRLAPSHPRALGALARYYEEAGDAARAQAYRARLEGTQAPAAASARPDPARTEHLLANARELARAGRYAEAVAKYREAFGAQPPDDRVALEYYQTLGGTPNGWADAKLALEQLATKNPGWPEAQLAYAQHLTYREATRREGIARLETLGAGPLAPQARKSERQALLWMAAAPADRPLYERWLERTPDDAEMRAKLAASATGSGQSAALGAGFDRLSHEDLAGAEQRFLAVLKARPRDVDALVGLASVRLKQREFVEARALLRRARDAAPGRRAQWEKPLRSAELWAAIGEAEEARRAGDAAKAEAILVAAAAASPDEGWNAERLLAILRAERNDDAEAEASYRRVLAKDPGDRAAVRGLFVLLLRAGRPEDADALEAKALAATQDGAKRKALQSDLLAARAYDAVDRGDPAAARDLVERAIAGSADDRGLRLRAVYLRLENGDAAGARELAEQLTREAPDDDDAWAALAVVRDATSPREAAEAARKIDATRAGADARRVRAQVLLEAEVDEALALRAAWGEAAVRARLADLEARAARDPALRAIVAGGWVRAGDPERGAELARAVLASQPPPSRALRLRCGWVLVAAGPAREAELAALVARIAGEPRLSAGDRRQLAAMRRTLAVRDADRARAAGDYRRAFARLEPELAEAPDDPALLIALARLYGSAGEPRKARALWGDLLAKKPDDPDRLEGAVQASLDARDLPDARDLAKRWLDGQPDSARAWLAAGRVAEADGDDRIARERFQHGLDVARARRADPKARDDDASAATSAWLRDARARFGAEGAPSGPNAGDPIEHELEASLRRVDERYAPGVDARFVVRYRGGEPGLGRLFDLSAPVQLHVSPGRVGRLWYRATPVYLTAGRTDLGVPDVAERFGSNAAYVPAATGSVLTDRSAGIAQSLGWDWKGLSLEAGVTPLGFRHVDPVGAVGWKGELASGFTLGVKGYRRAVTDSQLSYDARRDRRSGELWGAVRESGVSVDLAYASGPFALYGGVAVRSMNGVNVLDNLGGKYLLGTRWRLFESQQHVVTTGLSGFAMHFEKNQRYFTFGHGGYFSPQGFVALGVPLIWEARPDKVRWRVEAELGGSWFHEDDAPLFPTSPGLQAARAAQPETAHVVPGSTYPGQDRFGAYGRGAFELELQVGQRSFVTQGATVQLAPYYDEVFGWIGFHGDFL